jgi:hypothetical protein
MREGELATIYTAHVNGSDCCQTEGVTTFFFLRPFITNRGR